MSEKSSDQLSKLDSVDVNREADQIATGPTSENVYHISQEVLSEGKFKVVGINFRRADQSEQASLKLKVEPDRHVTKQSEGPRDSKSIEDLLAVADTLLNNQIDPVKPTHTFEVIDLSLTKKEEAAK